METIQEKRKKFLDETVNFYGVDTTRRANEGSRCQYRTSDGRGCAIGRHLPDKLAKELDNLKVTSVFDSEVFSKLPEDLKELGKDFLYIIQYFHDSDRNWCEEGLTIRGKNTYQEILNKFCIEELEKV